MPELPDVVVYIEALQQRIVGRTLERVRIAPCVGDGFLVMDPSDPNTLYVVESDVWDGAYWVRKSVDGGATWTAADSGLAGVTGVGTVVTSLVVASNNRNILYAGTSGEGVYKSFPLCSHRWRYFQAC